MTIEQKNAGKLIFAEIADMVQRGAIDEAYRIIEETDPPKEWLIELDSKIKVGDKYDTVIYEVQEWAMRQIFGRCGVDSISVPIITQDKSGRYSATVSTTYFYTDFKGEKQYLPGIATEIAGDISFLPLVVPKASTMANKNAIKQLGKLFGKGLNKEVDAEAEIPVSPPEDLMTHEERMQMLSDQLTSCKDVSELKSYRYVIFAKGVVPELQTLYEKRFKELQNKK